MPDWSEDKINCIFIRHGMTVSNRSHRYLGRTDEPLDEEGIELIKKAAMEGAYDKAQTVFSSPLSRCLQTAKIIYPTAGIEIIEELSEMDFGDFEMKNYEELSQNPKYSLDYQAWIDSGGTGAFPNGESRDAFIKRSVSGFEKAIDSVSEQNTVAFVVHGGTIMAVLSHYCGGDYFDYQVKNGCGYRCNVSRIDGKICFDDVKPLSPLTDRQGD